MRKRIFKKNIFSFLLVGFLSWGLLGITQVVYSESGPEYQCLDCHDDVWDEGQAKRFVHQPFQEQECQKCHVDAPFEDKKQQSSLEQSQVTWISRNYTPMQSHWVRFSAPEDNGEIFIEAEAQRGKTLGLKLSLPPLDDLQRYDDDKTAPKIKNVKVLEVKKGIFLTAVIGWETDEVANSLVNYGIKKLNLSSSLDNSFTTSHQITLTGFSSKEIYKFNVVSEDMFGNQSTSDVFNLLPAETFSHLNGQSSTDKLYARDIDLRTEILQSDGLYLFKITANQPVKLSLGSLPASFRKSGDVKVANSTQAVKHVITNGAFHLNISICYGCHREYQEAKSHPVNVYPKKGIVIPPEYPTLADGRMTCMSCHTRHASDLSGRLIKDSLKELCVGCHKGMQ